MEKQLLPINHLDKYYKKIYLKHRGSKPQSDLHIFNIYELNNYVSMTILGGCIEFENLYKDKAYDVMKVMPISEIKKKVKMHNNPKDAELKNKIKSMKNYEDLFTVISKLMFGQLRTLVNNILNINNEIGIQFARPVGFKMIARSVNLWRNHIAHGGNVTSEIMDDFGNSFKLAKLLKNLFKLFPKVSEELNSLLTNYNSSKIGIDISNIVVDLKIQALLDFTGFTTPIKIEEFEDFIVGRDYGTSRMNLLSVSHANKFSSKFGTVRANKLFSVKASSRKEVNYHFISEYRSFLIFKEENSTISKHERTLKLLLSLVNKKMNIKYSDFSAIIGVSYIDQDRLKKMCRAFKINVNKATLSADPQKIIVNKMISEGYKKYSSKYLVKNNSEGIYKIIGKHPYVVKKAPLIRTNNHGRKSKNVFIDGKLISLHRLVAELFIPNPHNYKYCIVNNMNYLNFNMSDIKWVKRNTHTREIKRKKKSV